MASPKITLNGVVINALGSKEEGWSVTIGTRPFMSTFDIPRPGLEGIFSQGGVSAPKTLRFEQGNLTHEFDFIYIVNTEPADNPHMARIVLADRRIWWPYIHILKRYNMRRRVGTKRRGLFQDELQQAVVPEIQYANYSLNPSTEAPWTPTQFLTDIFTSDDGLNVPSGQFFVDSSMRELDSIPIDNLQVNDAGDRAVARALASIPGSDVTIDPDGKVKIFSRIAGTERNITGTGAIGGDGAIGPEIVGGGHVEVVTNEFMRPQSVDVFFTIESELRFDFVKAVAPGATITEPGDEDLFMDNVAPIPDFDLVVAEETQFFGTYLPIGDLLNAWTDQLPGEALITQLDQEILDKAFIPGVGFFASLDLLGQLDSDPPRALWTARIAALQENYRQTFRINPEWKDRIFMMKPYLVATIDVVNGQRAPARAFANHSYLPSRKALIKAARNGQDLFFAYNVEGYPGENVELTDAVQPSPARVEVVDSDQGIIKINYLIDPFGFKDKVLPGKILNSGTSRAPKNSFRQSDEQHPPAVNAVSFNGFNVPRLDPEMKVAVLLTATPAAPNSKAQYYKINVSPSDIRRLLPAGAQTGLSNARGPVKQIYIGPGIETARVRWREADRDTIKKIFGIDGTLDDPIEGEGPGGENISGKAIPTIREQLEELCINAKLKEDVTDQQSAASLEVIAQAAAASIYAQHHERVLGSITGPLQNQRIQGTINQIRTFVDGSGASLIQANLPAELDPISFFAFMDASTRNIVMRLPVMAE